MNYLTLVKEFVAELGVGGANNGATVPDTILNQTGQLWNAANWIKQAENNINISHPDWKYLNVDYSEALVIGSADVPAHSGTETVRQWDRSSFWLDITTTAAKQLAWMDWVEFRSVILPGSAARPSSLPSWFSIKRDNSILINNPSDKAYALTAEFWKRPDLLVADAQEIAMPEQFSRLIICEAAIKYGNKEAAPEVIQGMEAEYIHLLNMLESDQLPGYEYETMGSQDIPLVIDVPGFADDFRVR